MHEKIEQSVEGIYYWRGYYVIIVYVKKFRIIYNKKQTIIYINIDNQL